MRYRCRSVGCCCRWLHCRISYHRYYIHLFVHVEVSVRGSYTLWCANNHFRFIHSFSQRFKQEQQKIEAMSAASGHTFSYVNKHGPPTMSRMSIDDRYGRSWTTHYSDSQQHLLSSSSGSGNSTNPPTYYGMVMH